MQSIYTSISQHETTARMHAERVGSDCLGKCKSYIAKRVNVCLNSCVCMHAQKAKNTVNKDKIWPHKNH